MSRRPRHAGHRAFGARTLAEESERKTRSVGLRRATFALLLLRFAPPCLPARGAFSFVGSVTGGLLLVVGGLGLFFFSQQPFESRDDVNVAELLD